MRARSYRRNQGSGSRRKTIGAVAVAGVLLAAGLTGVQMASAGTESKAVDLVNVDGQQFDVSQCADLQINGGVVVCDGEELAPVEEQGAGDAAAASAQALELACDTFAADIAAAEGGAEEEGAEEEGAGAGEAGAGAAGKGAAGDKAERKALAKKWVKVLKAAKGAGAEKGAGNGKGKGAEEGAGEAGAGAEEGAGGAGADEGDAGAGAAEAVVAAQTNLLQSCLALADAKAALAAEEGAAEEGAAEEGAGADEGDAGAEEEAGTTEK